MLNATISIRRCQNTRGDGWVEAWLIVEAGPGKDEFFMGSISAAIACNDVETYRCWRRLWNDSLERFAAAYGANLVNKADLN